jgi:hypothetical protein
MKKRPKMQNPYFSYATEHPSGKPLKPPDTTLSRDIEIGADGPPKTPLQITDTHNGTLKVLSPANAEYNDSGRFFMRVEGLSEGMHTFGLRPNSSSLPSDQWSLTVGNINFEDFDSEPEQSIEFGQHIKTNLLTILLLSGNATIKIVDLSKTSLPPPPQPGKMSGNILNIVPKDPTTQNNVSILFNLKINKLSFWHYGVNDANTVVLFYGTGGLLGQKPLSHSSQITYFEGSFPEITSIQILSINDGFLLDHLWFEV